MTDLPLPHAFFPVPLDADKQAEGKRITDAYVHLVSVLHDTVGIIPEVEHYLLVAKQLSTTHLAHLQPRPAVVAPSAPEPEPLPPEPEPLPPEYVTPTRNSLRDFDRRTKTRKEICNFINERGCPTSSNEIAEALGLTTRTVAAYLRGARWPSKKIPIGDNTCILMCLWLPQV